MKSFFTLAKPAVTEIIIRKSRFITSVAPVIDEEQAISFVDKAQTKHSNATHNVFGYVVNEQLQRFSDDGEPSGTAGKPVLELINRKGLIQTTIVVTRYYGGVQLGAGGLIRAYSEAAATGIEAAGIVEKIPHRQVQIVLDYQWLGLVKRQLEHSNAMDTQFDYGQKVKVTCFVRPDLISTIKIRLTDGTAAQVGISIGELSYF